MNFLEKIDFIFKLFTAIVFKKKSPLIISWNITYKCNLRCKYCGWWKPKAKELTTAEVICLVKKLASMKSKAISFSGGEPLLRDDLEEIIDVCKREKIYVSINTNGTLVKSKINKIKKADIIRLSLDGPADVNDFVRGKGVYDSVIESILTCKKTGLKVEATATISRYNVNHILDILNIAKKYGIKVYFQPADHSHFYSSKQNFLSWLADEDDYKKAITLLIKEKNKGNIFIGNTVAGLKYLYYWPHPRRITCFMKYFFCNIDPDGRIFICDSFPNYRKFSKPIDSDFGKTFYSLSLPYLCKQCWCASFADLNSLASFKENIVLNLWRGLKRL
ncbi:MAG: radical SAM protein [Candidatus Omnitrophica bacterium]|nr:radical SAM protein [Candidatus Omnitrophota bacterium]